MAEMQGCYALKQFMRKGGMSFSRILRNHQTNYKEMLMLDPTFIEVKMEVFIVMCYFLSSLCNHENIFFS